MAEIGSNLQLAAQWLEHNVVAIPTETVYGLAANALRPDLVARIFEVKQRPFFDPLIVHIASLEQVSSYAQRMHPSLRRLAEAFWPGPLSLLLPRTEQIPDIVTSGLPQVALRIPAHPLSLELLKALPFPLAAPSANPFGYVSPTTAQHVQDQLGPLIPYILDGGPCQVGLESTIAGMENEQLCVYRLGGLPLEQIEEVAGRKVHLHLSQSSNPRAPGMLKSHYAPRIPFMLSSAFLPEQAHGKRIFFIRFSTPLEGHPAHLQAILSPVASLREAACRLFETLRRADASGADLIVAEPVPDEGLGRAINDRLRRAAAQG